MIHVSALSHQAEYTSFILFVLQKGEWYQEDGRY
jgi:hypothetical protein